MRQQVIRRLKTLAITSSSLVLSRPFAITRDINFERVRITDRLDRLGYRRVNSKPERPGQYFAASGEALIFLREAQLGPGARQDEMLVRAVLDSQGMIKDLQTVPGKHALPSVWLEPEILSLLGTSSTRAQIAKVLPDFSPLLVKAVLATEDERFYLHFGVDPVAIVRAALLNITAGRIVQGGSTITQQLAKNLFLSSERSLLRKVREALAAVFIETAFTKEQILTLYLNQVFLGQEGKVAIHGFGEASRTFFDKDVADLSLAEAATLAGMVKAPTKYSPRRYPDRAAERRLVVLERMREAGVITEREAQNAAAEKLHVKTGQRNRRTAPYFVDYVRQQVNTLLENSDSAEGPLHVLTGIDPEAQKCANTAVRLGLRKLEAANPRLGRGKSALQAALIAVYPATGEIAAWVGGRDYGKNQFDRVSMAKRQPGSAFKPFVYLTALAGELNNYRVARTTNTLLDEPLTINIPGSGSWSPQNYDEEFRGEVTLRQALAQSLNVPTVRLAMKVGINHVARTAALFGFGEALPAVPSLALGAGEVTPMELARAYAAIANGGLLMDLR
ncbi:MAG TPA: transglycosylase domain-containing protein, partial [Oligoflexia bacterium]|nr:transglycosylase domain-containing protein [Oligoflexia bacterium]